MRTIRHALALVALAACALTPRAHAEGAMPSRTQPLLGPAATLDLWAQAFRARSPQGIGAWLTTDYRGHSPGEDVSAFDSGRDRAGELNTLEHLLLGLSHEGRTVLPSADSAGFTVDGLRELADPEHADSTQHYRLVTVMRLEYAVRRRDGRTMRAPAAPQVFQMVRGDAAALDSTQRASASVWYVRGWFEDLNGIRRMLARVEGECPEAIAPGRDAPRPLAPFVRPLAGPTCPQVRVNVELPGRETARVQILDVSGRLENERALIDPQPGVSSIEVGAGARIAPGVHWVRLVQGSRPAAVRRVLVAR